MLGWKFVQMFQVAWPRWLSGPYMVKTFKHLMTLKLGIQDRVLKYYKYVQMMTLSWPWPFLWHGQICFLMLLHGWKLIQHIVMYFQACSNSAYPQHSGERYRTNGPLVPFSRPSFTASTMSAFIVAFFQIWVLNFPESKYRKHLTFIYRIYCREFSQKC